MSSSISYFMYLLDRGDLDNTCGSANAVVVRIQMAISRHFVMLSAIMDNSDSAVGD